MDTTKHPRRSGLTGLVALLLTGALLLGSPPAQATDTDLRFFDRSALRVSTGTSEIDSSAAVWTGFLPVITCTPPAAEGMLDVTVVVDLATPTTGWASTATSETIQLAVQRAVDGTNYRTDVQDVTTATSGTNAAARSVTLHVGPVGPGESFKVAAKLSAEVVSDTILTWAVYYRAPDRATFTGSVGD